MANHVRSVIEFHKINDEAKAKLVELVSRCREQEYNNLWFGDMFVEGELTHEDVEQYSWTTENLGTKWCYIEEFDEDSLMMITNSAWSSPELGVINLVKELNKLDDKIVWSIKYEDEMPNFIGAYVFVNDEVVDGAEDDSEEIREGIFALYPNLQEHWDEEEDYWKSNEDGDLTEESEEAYDEYGDVLFDWISERQDELVNSALSYLDESEEEE